MSLPPATDHYVGDPDYPSPWTTSRPLEGLRDIDAARVVSLSPDVCLTPCGSSAVAVPYPVVDFCGHDVNYTPSVRFTRKKAMVLRSHTTHVHGDSPGREKGVKSGTVEGICEPMGHASQVRAEGSPVIRHLDRFWMNNRNTVGEALFVRDTSTHEAPLDDDPIPGSLRMMNAKPVQVAYAGTGAFAFANTGAAPLAQAMPATPAQVPAPSPAPAPAPQPPGTVIRPGPQRAPQWYRTPPHRVPRPPVGPGLLGRFGKFGLGRIPLLGLLIPDNGANLSDVVPQNDFERRVVEMFYEGIEEGEDSWDMREWAMEELRRHREAQPQPQPTPVPAPQPDTVTVSDEDGSQRRCLVGPYEEIEPLCRGDAHHIVPDMAYRLGARPTTAAAKASTENRVPNAPTFNQGMSICLLTRQHGSGPEGLHGQLRQRFLDMSSPVPGTAPMGAILADSLLVIQEIPDLPLECKALAETMATGQVFMHTGFSAPGRIKEQPLPTGDAKTVLEQGHY